MFARNDFPGSVLATSESDWSTAYGIRGDYPYIGKLSTSGGASLICALPGEVQTLPTLMDRQVCAARYRSGGTLPHDP
ncbi:hypothetical protein [Mycolicibacterium peregrinum]|uniref:hypothetical protein n=1 Tax=Mycolicibacterium peregrinum TaxID=43304 RepID=UPI003AAD77CB